MNSRRPVTKVTRVEVPNGWRRKLQHLPAFLASTICRKPQSKAERPANQVKRSVIVTAANQIPSNLHQFGRRSTRARDVLGANWVFSLILAWPPKSWLAWPHEWRARVRNKRKIVFSLSLSLSLFCDQQHVVGEAELSANWQLALELLRFRLSLELNLGQRPLRFLRGASGAT